MKSILLTLVLVMVLAIGANAQSEMKLSAQVGGGVALPMGDTKDSNDMGFGGGAGFGVQFHPMFAVVGKVTYFMLPYSDDVGTGLDDATALFFGADVHFYPPLGEPGEMAFAPYILAGAGMTSLDPKNGFESSTEFTWEIGGGFEYMFSPKMAGWLEAKYVTISADDGDAKLLPIWGGIKFFFGQE